MTSENFDLFSYFSGKKRAYGLFQDRFGVIKRRFTVDITGSVCNNILQLDERFTYDDGETDTRIWQIETSGFNQFIGKADDVIGTAQGKVSGLSLHWQYRLALKVNNRTINVSFDDWMFLMPDEVLINRAEIKKFGLLIGTVFISFKPIED